MNVGLAIAGLLCLAMALGHTTIGLVWVLPSLSEDHLPGTPFGGPGMSVGMVRVTWYVVTVFVLTLGAVLTTLAWAPDAHAESVLLRWFAAGWLTAAAMAFWINGRRNLRSLLRLPVPFVWIVVAGLLWNASM